MSKCIDEGTLQAWFDGELAAEAAAHVAAHLQTCAQCAAALQDIEAENSILAAGLAAEFAEAIPTERLRQRVDTAVAQIRVEKAARSRPPWFSTLHEMFLVRGLAYASVALVLLLAGVLTFVYLSRNRPAPQAKQETPVPVSPQPSPSRIEQPPGPTAVNTPKAPSPREVRRRRNPNSETPANTLAWQEQQYERAIARLNEAIKSQAPLRPSLQVEYEYNLALIDNAISTTRDVARKNPKDPQAAQFMLSAYQSKVDLMNQIADARSLER
jgi:hypothetical protein